MMEKNILLTVSYDGTPFSGWQRQPGRMTVQGELERAVSELVGRPVKINGCSRTDAGVHALGQRAGFSEDISIPVENIRRALNDMLPGSIRIVSCEEKPEGFHARFDSRGKTYIYRIVNGPMKDPFERNYCYHVRRPLDVDKMRRAAAFIEGTHDFACFQASGGQERETTVRTIYELDIEEEKRRPFLPAGREADDADGYFGGKEIVLSVTGDGFLYNMVRIITGTLVDAGLGKILPENLPDIIEGKDRRKAGHTAPARGLYLAEVYYGDKNTEKTQLG